MAKLGLPLLRKIVGEENMPDVCSVAVQRSQQMIFKELIYLEDKLEDFLELTGFNIDNISITRVDNLFCEHAYIFKDKRTNEKLFSTPAFIL